MSVIQNYDSSANKLVIRINGSFNFNLHAAFRETYRNIEAEKKPEVIVDMQNADYMDSSALGMLLLLDEHFNGQTIKIEHCSEYIKQVLQVANFDKKFKIS